MTGPSSDRKAAAIRTEETASVAAALRRAPAATLPVILCFFTGEQPAAATAMPRNPDPGSGMPFRDDFTDVFAEAVRVNGAIHDGAVMIGRARPDAEYLITGWSHRLHPPPAGLEHANKGSAFNSCLAMSAVHGVDQLVLVARDGTFEFRGGIATPLADIRATQRAEGVDDASLRPSS